MPTVTILKLNTKKVPKLRFPSFSDSWDEKRLGDTGNIITGTTPSTFEKEYYGDDFPWITPTDIISKKDIYTSAKFLTKKGIEKGRFIPKNSLLVTCIASIGKNTILRVDGSCNQQINAVSPNDKNNVDFLYYLVEKSKNIFIKYAGAGGMQMLNKNDFAKIKLYMPKLPEQQKIAGFLGAVDEWIGNLKKQKENFEAYKKGMMQKIFSQEIRFKDDGGKAFPKWEAKKLCEVLDYEQPTNYIVESTEYNNKYKTPVLTAGKTFILGHTNELGGIFKNGLPVIIFDDFTTASHFVDFPFKVKSSAMKILKSRNNSNVKFVFAVIQQIKYKIGGHGRHWISKYSNIKILLPHSKEQQKIADFLTSIDKIIESKQQQITQAEHWKRGLRQGLFV